MHENETMALVSHSRISPLIMPHHMPGLPYTLSQRKDFDCLSKPSVADVFSVSFDDDDDFSDHDSHYSEDEIDVIPLQRALPQDHDVTRRLLSFVDTVNSDIQKFFGRRKGEEDSCDIYEEKWTSGKSGRELYYADLLKIAQGGDTDRPKKSNKSSQGEIKDNRNTFTGVMDKHAGLGPLQELFEYGLRNFQSENDFKNGRYHSKRLKSVHNRYTGTVPMSNRKLPESFWKEPRTCVAVVSTVPTSMQSSIHTTKPPDFSDLLHHWTGGTPDEGEFHADLSSSEMSMTSSDSG